MFLNFTLENTSDACLVSTQWYVSTIFRCQSCLSFRATF